MVLLIMVAGTVTALETCEGRAEDLVESVTVESHMEYDVTYGDCVNGICRVDAVLVIDRIDVVYFVDWRSRCLVSPTCNCEVKL